jgi:predicted nucleotidyltransferase
MKADLAALRGRILGAYLWGSHVTGGAHARSDVDVCLVGGPGRGAQDVLRDAWTRVDGHGIAYDFRAFEEMPLFLQGEVLDSGILLFAEDEPRLSEYLRPIRKLWEDQAARRHRTPEDVERILAARRQALG